MITPICFKPITQIRQKRFNESKDQQNVSFCALAQYDRFVGRFSNFRASCYFRREGGNGYKDVVNALKLVSRNSKRPKILVVGLGDAAQEPCSILATIKSLNPKKPLKDSVELNCVDMQPQISDIELKNHSYLDKLPSFARTSFQRVKNSKHYEVKPEIYENLNETLNNSAKTKWDTTIEDFSPTLPEQSYDMVSINNVLCYVLDETKKVAALENLTKSLKPGGILVTDPYDILYKDLYPCLKELNNLTPGIWQKMA